MSADSVAARARDADIVVLHGLGAGAPDWARQVAAQAPRTVVFVSDPAGAVAAGVRVVSSQPGEWYLDTELPPSPLLADLAALTVPGAPAAH